MHKYMRDIRRRTAAVAAEGRIRERAELERNATRKLCCHSAADRIEAKSEIKIISMRRALLEVALFYGLTSLCAVSSPLSLLLLLLFHAE